MDILLNTVFCDEMKCVYEIKMHKFRTYQEKLDFNIGQDKMAILLPYLVLSLNDRKMCYGIWFQTN